MRWRTSTAPEPSTAAPSILVPPRSMPMRNRGAIGLQSFARAGQISGYRLLSSIAYNMRVLPVGNDDHQPLPDRDRSSAATSALYRGRRRMTLEISTLNGSPN